MVVPKATPFTMPVAEPTVATPVALLLHTPPVTALAKVIDCSTQTLLEPVMAADGLTVTVASELQPVLNI